jgi:nitric oxide reductase NorQ protein
MKATMSSPASQHLIDRPPYYLRTKDEVQQFEAAYRAHLPVMLKGPTGCGKTRFVAFMAHRLRTAFDHGILP